jgi:MFS transporter, AAHS family, 4-hydroxybenzoate transporter
MSVDRSFDISAFLRRPETVRRRAIFIVAALLLAADGLDLAVVGNILPGMARSYGVPIPAMSIIFVFQGLGLAIGAYGIGPLADRFGRRPLLLASGAGLTLATLATILARSPEELAMVRLASGVFMGALHPNLIALTSEYTPPNRVERRIVYLNTIFGLGSAFGGIIAPPLMIAFDWQAVFVVVAAFLAVMLAASAWLLPESLMYLVTSGRSPEKIGRIVRRLDRDADVGEATTFTLDETSCKRGPSRFAIADLFTQGRAMTTVLLWATAVISLALVATITSWKPTLFFVYGQLSQIDAGRMSAVSSIGSIIGAFVMVAMMQRLGSAKAVATAFIGGGLSLLLFAWMPQAPALGWVISFGFGAFCISAHVGLTAMAARIYPTEVRASGVGATVGAGRVASIIAPMLVGGILAAGWSAGSAALALSLPYVGAAVLILLVGRASLSLKRNTKIQINT